MKKKMNYFENFHLQTDTSTDNLKFLHEIKNYRDQ